MKIVTDNPWPGITDTVLSLRQRAIEGERSAVEAGWPPEGPMPAVASVRLLRDAAGKLETARGIIRQLLDGEVPAIPGDGHWYGLDETCCPTYKGRAATDAERALLAEIREDGGD